MWLRTPEWTLVGIEWPSRGLAARARARLDRIRRSSTSGDQRSLASEPTAETIQRARAGDPDAFALLFDAFGDDVLRVCLRMLGAPEVAADARSDVFLKVRGSLSSYDPARSFRTWLLSVAGNHCIDRLRRDAVERRLFAQIEIEPGELEGSTPSPLSRVVARENRDALDRALASLPVEYRLPLLMRYFGDASYDEIADSLGTNRARVGTLIFRAKKKMRVLMTTETETPAGGEK